LPSSSPSLSLSSSSSSSLSAVQLVMLSRRPAGTGRSDAALQEREGKALASPLPSLLFSSDYRQGVVCRNRFRIGDSLLLVLVGPI
jgi:hypothetical protein